MDQQSDVLIIGGGLAGLTCAVTLHQQGVNNRILEATDSIGGCIRTDRIEGFLFDRGFQVLSTAYPQTQHLLQFQKLGLRTFTPGALVWYGGRFRRVADPFRQPLSSLASLFQPIGSIKDKLLIAKLRRNLLTYQSNGFDMASPQTTLQYLRDFQFSDEMIDRFFRPFLNGIFHDSNLETSANKFLFVMKMFAEGDAALPRDGMGSIPAQLASQLPPNSIQLGAQVISVQNNSVTLDSGEQLVGRAVVVATDGFHLRNLLPQISDPPPQWKSVTCLYYSSPRPPISGPWLVLNGERTGIVNHLSVLSEVAPTYSPNGKSLISVSIPGTIGEEAIIDSQVRNHMTAWFGSEVRGWKLLRSYSLPFAQPLQIPGFYRATPGVPKTLRDVYIAGAHQEFATIEGAIASGRKIAHTILANGT